MESRATFKNVKASPKKLRFLLPELKKMSPSRAVDHLFYSNKKGARILYKIVRSAMANAKATLKTDEHLLQFKALSVDEGNTLKRYKAGGKGNVKPIAREFSHVTVILEAVKTAPKAIEKPALPEAKKEVLVKKEQAAPVKKTEKKVTSKKAKK